MGGIAYRRDRKPAPGRLADRLAEAWSVRKALLVALTTDAQRDAYRARYPRMADRIATVRWGYDADLVGAVQPAEVPAGVRRLVIFGRFAYYGARDAAALADAVAAAGGPWEVVHVGHPETELRAAFEARGIADRLSETGMMPYADGLALVASADCAALNPFSPASVPVKTYDYIGLRRPILAFAGAGCALADLLADYPAAAVVQDAGGAAAFLDGVAAGTVGDVGDLPGEEFSMQHQFGMLVECLERIRSGEGGRCAW
jgi:hypothetical protein